MSRLKHHKHKWTTIIYFAPESDNQNLPKMDTYIQNPMLNTQNCLVVEPTHLKNLLLKLDHFPGVKTKNLWVATTQKNVVFSASWT